MGKYFWGDLEIFLCLTFSRWGGVGRLRVASSAQGVSLGSVLIIEAVEVLGGGAVEVEPPVADEVVLVEESSVGAEEAVLGEATSSVSGADVESLALGLGVRVVTYRERSAESTESADAGSRSRFSKKLITIPPILL